MYVFLLLVCLSIIESGLSDVWTPSMESLFSRHLNDWELGKVMLMCFFQGCKKGLRRRKMMEWLRWTQRRGSSQSNFYIPSWSQDVQFLFRLVLFWNFWVPLKASFFCLGSYLGKVGLALEERVIIGKPMFSLQKWRGINWSHILRLCQSKGIIFSTLYAFFVSLLRRDF